MVKQDPYDPTRSYYECSDCGRRFTTQDHEATCEECGGDLRNIAVPRE
jgi:rRNA maturation endonuclease Nob1